MSDQPASLATTELGASGIAALRRLPFLDGIAQDRLLQLASAARWLVLAPGQTIVDAGDQGAEVFFVAEGRVRVVVRSVEGHEVILNDLDAGEHFGELAAIDGLCRSATVTALSRARICAVPGRVFLDAVLATPAAGLRLLRLLAARVRLKDQRTLEAAALPTRQRLIAELLRMSSPRGDGERRISPPPPQQVIAARLGLRRETVSRELAKLVRESLVSLRRGAIILHDAEALKAEVDALLSLD